MRQQCPPTWHWLARIHFGKPYLSTLLDTEFDTNGRPVRHDNWVEALGHQLGYDYKSDTNFWEKGIWLCPGVKSQGIKGGSFESYGYNAFGIGTNSDSLGLGGHYGLTHITENFNIGGHAFGIADLKPPVLETDIVNPSEMMAIGDGFNGNASQIFSGQDFLWQHNSSIILESGVNSAEFC
jgi:hypothetical protein